jgi:hypothetical protein
MPVPVDVIRVDFWTRVAMKIFDVRNNYELRVVPRPGQEKFKIPIDAIDISGNSSPSSSLRSSRKFSANSAVTAF